MTALTHNVAIFPGKSGNMIKIVRRMNGYFYEVKESSRTTWHIPTTEEVWKKAVQYITNIANQPKDTVDACL